MDELATAMNLLAFSIFNLSGHPTGDTIQRVYSLIREYEADIHVSNDFPTVHCQIICELASINRRLPDQIGSRHVHFATGLGEIGFMTVGHVIHALETPEAIVAHLFPELNEYMLKRLSLVDTKT